MTTLVRTHRYDESSPMTTMRGVVRAASVVVGITTLLLMTAAPHWLVQLTGGSDSASWIRQAALGATGLRILALMLGSFCGCVLIGSVIRRLMRHRMQRADLAGCQRGTAMIEFALLFPVALTLFLIMIQAAFLYVGNFYVNFAAFKAARAAIVHGELSINPAETGDATRRRNDPRYYAYELVVSSQMIEHAQRAAAFACIGISGTTTDIDVDVDSPYDNDSQSARQDSTWSSFIGRTQGWSGEKLQQRHSYALSQTRVTQPRVGERLRPVYKFGRRTAIRVEVEHDFELAIPFANRLIGDATFQDQNGYRFIRLRATQPMVMDRINELVLPGVIATALFEDIP